MLGMDFIFITNKNEQTMEEKIFKIGTKFFIAWFFMMYLFVWGDTKTKQPQEEEVCSVIEEMKVIEKKKEKDKVTVTVYNPVTSQCDSDPLITADNSKIDLAKLKKGKLKWVAVSRDLLRSGKVKYGDRIRIECKEDPSLSGTYTVHDTMHPRWKNHVDILAHQDVRTTGKYGGVEIEYLDNI